MLNRRKFTHLLGATAVGAFATPGLVGQGFAQNAATAVTRGNYLIKNGSVITVDAALGVLPRADVHVRNGRIEAIGPDLVADGAETIDASDMIVMPGFIDTHYHMWSAIGRNFIGDGFGYFPAKSATSKLFTADDFYSSVMLGLVELANGGVTSVHNWSPSTPARRPPIWWTPSNMSASAGSDPTCSSATISRPATATPKSWRGPRPR
jgi:5-methylthioadenosine/S-adenosylhomocysteine deaminase